MLWTPATRVQGKILEESLEMWEEDSIFYTFVT